MSLPRPDAQYRDQPSLFEFSASAPQPTKRTEQERQIARVKASIGDVILDFFRHKRVGDRFFAADLHKFVESRARVAPASADRVMRELRLAKSINYSLVSRPRSEYRVEQVS